MNVMHKSRLPISIVLLGGVSFLNELSSQIVAPLIPLLLATVLVLLHRGFDCLGVSRIERGQVGIGYLDSDAPGGAGLA